MKRGMLIKNFKSPKGVTRSLLEFVPGIMCGDGPKCVRRSWERAGHCKSIWMLSCGPVWQYEQVGLCAFPIL